MFRCLFLIIFLGGCISAPKPEIQEEINNNDVGVIRDPAKSLPKMPTVEYHSKPLSDREAKLDLEIPIYSWGHALFPDTQYIKIKYSSFIEFNKWFEDATRQLYHKDIGDGFDCDNFAHLYKALFSVSSYKNSSKHEVLVGTIYVKQRLSFGGIKGGDYNHALNIIGTSSGWFVYEPQTGVYDRLESYPNKIIWYLF
tara:strand:+ start:1564 stop:2154 length:591 start_codon:yes stop_codon:yes gene_type:complete